jgi:hypothetical protein
MLRATKAHSGAVTARFGDFSKVQIQDQAMVARCSANQKGCFNFINTSGCQSNPTPTPTPMMGSCLIQ